MNVDKYIEEELAKAKKVNRPISRKIQTTKSEKVLYDFAKES